MLGFTINLDEINTITIVLRMVLSILIGGAIGIEREVKNQPAGFRTYSLVCLGASMVMMTNQYIAHQFGNVDSTRMGAQVISGIGFLGAGTIMVTAHNQVRGLTTAAGLWAAACTGLAIEDVNISKSKKNRATNIVVLFILKCERRQNHAELMQQFSKIYGLKHIEELR